VCRQGIAGSRAVLRMGTVVSRISPLIRRVGGIQLSTDTRPQYRPDRLKQGLHAGQYGMGDALGEFQARGNQQSEDVPVTCYANPVLKEWRDERLAEIQTAERVAREHIE